MAAINFWTPVRYEGDLNCRETLTQTVDSYFSLGCCQIAVIDICNQNTQFIHERPAFLSTALKIVSYMTILMPLIMLAAKLVLRCCYFRNVFVYQPYAPINNPSPPSSPGSPAITNWQRPTPPVQQPSFSQPPVVNVQRPTPVQQPSFNLPPVQIPQPWVPANPPRVVTWPAPAPINIQQPVTFGSPTYQPLASKWRPFLNQSVLSKPIDQTRTWASMTEQEQIELKLAINLRAYEVFKIKRDEQTAELNSKPEWAATAIEVDEYYQDRIARLTANENVPLAMYYHASRQNVDDIARDNMLIESRYGAASVNGDNGRGVYVSTRDEHYATYTYGDYTYALDASAVEQFEAYYFPGGATNNFGEEGGLWFAVKQNVPIDGTNTAHVAVPNEAIKATYIQKFWAGQSTEQGGIQFFAPIITRNASDVIRQCYTTAHRHLLPTTWKRRVNYDIAPSHVIEQPAELQKSQRNYGYGY